MESQSRQDVAAEGGAAPGGDGRTAAGVEQGEEGGYLVCRPANDDYVYWKKNKLFNSSMEETARLYKIFFLLPGYCGMLQV